MKEYKSNCKKIMKTESEILDKLKHKNIVNYYDNLTKEGYKKGINNHIIIELCGKENIQDYLNKEKSKINPKIIYTIIKDICLGLKEIHSKNIIHCDLKPSNILIGHDYKVKICDFGISSILEDTKEKIMSEMNGTLAYCAPELINEKKYSKKVDIWALGCIIYELWKKEPCFKIDSDIKDKINKVEYNKITDNKELQNLINLMLKKDPNERIDIKQVCKEVKNIISKIKTSDNYKEDY